jgi:hypothetical protein
MTSRDPNHDRLSHGNEKFQRIRTADTPSDWIALMAIAVRRKCDMATTSDRRASAIRSSLQFGRIGCNGIWTYGLRITAPSISARCGDCAWRLPRYCPDRSTGTRQSLRLKGVQRAKIEIGAGPPSPSTFRAVDTRSWSLKSASLWMPMATIRWMRRSPACGARSPVDKSFLAAPGSGLLAVGA